MEFMSPDPGEFRPGPDDLVCHCFGYTRKEIEKDFLNNGRSLITERIVEAKKGGSCDCANRNPRGR